MEDESIASTRQACTSCKKQKRRCDKVLPICGFCAHTKRTCDYTDLPAKPPSAADFAALQARLNDLEERFSASNTRSVDTASPFGPTAGSSEHSAVTSRSQNACEHISMPALILDVDCYKWMKMQLPRPNIVLPMDIVAILTQDENFIVKTSDVYFNTVHKWLPIVSKKRLALGYSLHDSGPDIAALFLAMRLITFPPGDESKHWLLYQSTKNFLAILEASGFVSLLCLQAMIFVATYEYGHAIYPAAWMTIGSCSRYADMIGLSLGRQSLKVLGKVHSWTAQEELRRAWWAIYILDRLVSLGSQRRFSFSDPPSDAILPVEDDVWDRGDAVHALHQPISVPLATSQPPFTRMCQAAMLISRALKSAQSSLDEDVDSLITIDGLSDEICDFTSAIESQLVSHHVEMRISMINPCCLAWSALFMLLDKLCCPEKLAVGPGFTFTGGAKGSAQLALQTKAVGLTESTSYKMQEVADYVISIVQGNAHGEVALAQLGPFSLYSLYCALVSFHWLHREGGQVIHKVSLTTLSDCMNLIGERWRLGKTLLQLTECYNAFSQHSNPADHDLFYS